ncbi:MAG: SMI1/KNR4 family protein [Lachnospiraceae bacterium]
MSINYNITAGQVLSMLGYDNPESRKFLDGIEKEYNIKLPAVLRDFYEPAYGCPLLLTADIWTDRFCTLYEVIEEQIEEFEEEYKDNPEEGVDDEYYKFSQFLAKIPREEWQGHVTNYLEIGSDYGAGVASYGICINDLDKEDPPVYYLNEDNEMTDWRLLCNTLSEYFMLVLCDTLLCKQYNTAREALNKDGWDYNIYKSDETEKAAGRVGIDLSALKPQVLSWGKTTCGYDKERKMIVAACVDDNCELPFMAAAISKK